MDGEGAETYMVNCHAVGKATVQLSIYNMLIVINEKDNSLSFWGV